MSRSFISLDKILSVPYQIDPEYGENERNETLVLGPAMTWMAAWWSFNEVIPWSGLYFTHSRPVRKYCLSQWSRGLRRRSAAARLLRSWVRIATGVWMFVCFECCVLSGRGLCDELITRPEESYRLWCVVVCDLETSRMRRPWPALGRSATGGKKRSITKIFATLILLQEVYGFVRSRCGFPLMKKPLKCNVSRQIREADM